MPVRKVANRGRNMIGYFPSLKMQRMVAFESTLERDYLYLLDYDREVQAFAEQPLTIEYWDGGKLRRYTPDFHVVGPGWDRLVECKPTVFAAQEENQRRMRAASAWCREQGWQFCLVTDQDVRAGFRLQNVKSLTRYARHLIAPGIRGHVYSLLLAAPGALTVAELLRGLAVPRPTALASLLGMVFHHEIHIPLDDAPIAGATPVYLPVAPGG